MSRSFLVIQVGHKSNDKVLIRHGGGSSIMTAEGEIGMLQALKAVRGKDWILSQNPGRSVVLLLP